MQSNNPYAAYKSVQTFSASQTKLIVMLHDGLIRFLAMACKATIDRDFPTKGKNFGKAFDILNHLIGTLDKDAGGKLAEDLDKFYRFFLGQLMVANATNDVALVKTAMGHLRQVRNAWATVDAQVQAGSQTVEMDRSERLQTAA